MKKSNQSLRVGLISLGCAKNLIDAEIMLGSLLKEGIQIVNNAAQADVVIVNTCSFIDSAQEESIDAILESARQRRQNKPEQALVVSGCLPQRFREELITLLPEVDAFIGIDQAAQIPNLIKQAIARRQKKIASETLKDKELNMDKQDGQDGQNKKVTKPASPIFNINAHPHYIPDFVTPRFRLTPDHFAYIKIAEGCNHPCSFCVIPRIRGSHRSRAQSDIVKEAKQLLSNGVKELNLISQDTTYYGRDLRPSATTLPALIRKLDALPGNFWIRLLYTHPAHWTDELIDTIAQSKKVARYVDIPLQHIHPAMLERMRRETSREHIVDLIGKIRAAIPGIAIRTTFIVGFPGETEAIFESLLEFIRKTCFERLGIFTYSREEGTRAGKMENQIPDPVKKQRRKRAMVEQLKIARAIAASWIGCEMNVLVERPAQDSDLQNAGIPSGRYLVARGHADAPDIDGRVYIHGTTTLGQFTQVKIIGHTDYDLIAIPIR